MKVWTLIVKQDFNFDMKFFLYSSESLALKAFYTIAKAKLDEAGLDHDSLGNTLEQACEVKKIFIMDESVEIVPANLDDNESIRVV